MVRKESDGIRRYAHVATGNYNRVTSQVYTDAHRERTIVVTTSHGGMGYVRKLRDMGISRADVDYETQKPFWRA